MPPRENVRDSFFATTAVISKGKTDSSGRAEGYPIMGRLGVMYGPSKPSAREFTPPSQRKVLSEKSKRRGLREEGEDGQLIVQVAGVGETVWSGNGLTFATWDEAKSYASNLLSRWTGADMARVVPLGTPNWAPIEKDDPSIVLNYRRESRKGKNKKIRERRLREEGSDIVPESIYDFGRHLRDYGVWDLAYWENFCLQVQITAGVLPYKDEAMFVPMPRDAGAYWCGFFSVSLGGDESLAEEMFNGFFGRVLTGELYNSMQQGISSNRFNEAKESKRGKTRERILWRMDTR